jgi:hypothetical protein
MIGSCRSRPLSRRRLLSLKRLVDRGGGLRTHDSVGSELLVVLKGDDRLACGRPEIAVHRAWVVPQQSKCLLEIADDVSFAVGCEDLAFFEDDTAHRPRGLSRLRHAVVRLIRRLALGLVVAATAG